MAAEGEAATERALHAYRKMMQSVTEFRYLGRVLTMRVHFVHRHVHDTVVIL